MTSLRRFVTLFESLDAIPHVEPEAAADLRADEPAAAAHAAPPEPIGDPQPPL